MAIKKFERSPVGKKYDRDHDRDRPSDVNGRSPYGERWRKARLRYLREFPLCRACADMGIVQPANVVDHIKPHRGDMALFWKVENWQPLCESCHSAKTAKGA